jgi:hypothetical protein
VEQTLDFVFAMITGLLGFLLRIALALELVARAIMHRFGVEQRAQNVAIMVVAIFLVLTGYRLFGGLIGILVTVFLMLLMIHVLWPDFLIGLQSAH